MEELIGLVMLLVSTHHGPYDRCIERHAHRIAEQLTETRERYDVPPALTLSVAFLETHVGCDVGEGGGWGAPIDRRHRGVAGDHNSSARALRRGYEACAGATWAAHSWLDLPHHRRAWVASTPWTRALAFYRCGLCQCPHLVGYQPANGYRFAVRIGGPIE